MTNYGNKIQYDDSRIPIEMSLPIDASNILRIWKENYMLPIVSEELSSDNPSRITYTFDESVDKHTFIRHLETATPQYYDSL